MTFSISKISLRTRLLLMTAFALLALLIAVLSAYRTAQTSAYYAERQAQTSVSTVLRELARNLTDEENFSDKRKIPPHIQEAFEKYKDVLTRSAVIALHGEPEVSAGYCSADGQMRESIRAQKFSSEELSYVENVCAKSNETGLRSYNFKDSTLYVATAQIEDNKREIASAFAIRSVRKSGIFTDYFSFLTQGFLLASAVGLLIFSALTLRDWRGGMQKIERGLQKIPTNLSARIEEPKISELAAVSREINRLAENLETNLEKQKQLETSLRRSEKLSALGRVASGVAHEIRNPLAAIKLKIQIAQRKRVDAKLDQTFRVVTEEIERLDAIVKRLLEFGKAQDLRVLRFDLNELLSNRTDFFADIAAGKNISIETENSGDSLLIEGDQPRLTEVFDNLLQNALNSIKDAGKISVKSTLSENFARIEISDTGNGISESDRVKIFEPFFTTRDDGTGLGLAIAREIVEAHGGKIYFDSEHGRGTTFFVELPARQSTD